MKGDLKISASYRGITLLNTAYKILTTLLNKRVTEQTEATIGGYQCGFRREISTVDAIHIINQIVEKAYELIRL